MAVLQLKILNAVFNIDQSTRAVLNVHLIGFDKFLYLPAAKVHRGCQVPVGFAVDVRVPMFLKFLSQCLIACDMPQFDQGLPLERCGKAARL